MRTTSANDNSKQVSGLSALSRVQWLLIFLLHSSPASAATAANAKLVPDARCPCLYYEYNTVLYNVRAHVKLLLNTIEIDWVNLMLFSLARWQPLFSLILSPGHSCLCSSVFMYICTGVRWTVVARKTINKKVIILLHKQWLGVCFTLSQLDVALQMQRKVCAWMWTSYWFLHCLWKHSIYYMYIIYKLSLISRIVYSLFCMAKVFLFLHDEIYLRMLDDKSKVLNRKLNINIYD